MKLRDLPGFPGLYTDLIEDTGSAREFFPWPANKTGLLERVSTLVSQAAPPQQKLCDLLSRQAELFHSGPASFSGIDKLRDPRCVVVAASMRPALFGGSLSSWLKIVTALRLAAWIESQGIPAVPVLWICSRTGEGEMGIGLPTHAGPRRFHLSLDPAVGPAIPGSVAKLLNQAAQALHVDLEDSDLLGMLRDAYTPGTDFSTAWARAISRLFESLGVVLVDPRQLNPDCFSSYPEKIYNINKLRDVSAAGMHSLEVRGYIASQSTKQFQAGDEFLESHGEKQGQEIPYLNRAAPFVVQSLLLPIAASVLDEEDSLLFAWCRSTFEHFSLTPPPAWPRASATILDPRSRALMTQYSLRLEDLFSGSEKTTENILETLNAAETLRRLDALRAGIENHLSELAQFARPADRLGFEVGKSRKRILFQIEKLRQRFCSAGQLRGQTVARHVARLCNALAPGGRLQEREFAGFGLVLLFSRMLPQILAERVNPWEFDHQLIYLE